MDKELYDSLEQNYINQVKQQLQVGDQVHIRSDYCLLRAVVQKINKKTVQVLVPAQWGLATHTSNVSYEKIAKNGIPVVFVWETWKGVNGRGGYRLDISSYPELAIPVEQIGWQNRLTEVAFQNATQRDKDDYKQLNQKRR